ncbi:Thiol-disulfide isomerase or thioredoxin [Allopseudospirillum japonicum]|uniref:Thiol-disulfide isomerase or thioredoxin n=1 Tax=Allopseudospirillum japonicum TaxID=64971 RepID=A0A1H6QZP5_9GAMM|nr:TlpA disulfide reductase family protein [Allopseudospirillum japonicum]SEI44745.1 Thiol-disulfide isomerase or thioredoxin [Allopseudospirillum japonicum]
MGEAITLGPLMLPWEKVFFVLGLLLALVSTEILGARLDRRFLRWSYGALACALIAGRLSFAWAHWPSFAADPVSLLFVWQGGIHWWAAFAAAGLWSVYYWRPLWTRLAWSGVPMMLFLGVWGFGQLSLSSTHQGQTLAENLQVYDLQGKATSLNTLVTQAAKPTVVNLWATWCGPCRREMPLLAELSQHPKIQIITVNQGESQTQVLDFLQQQALEIQPWFDPQQNLLHAFNAPGLPMTLFFNAQGQQVDRHLGELSRVHLDTFIREYAQTQD